MSMTRKHFIDLADVVVEMDKYGLNGTQLEELTQAIGFTCKKHNSNFDYTRFEDYILERLNREEFCPTIAFYQETT